MENSVDVVTDETAQEDQNIDVRVERLEEELSNLAQKIAENRLHCLNLDKKIGRLEQVVEGELSNLAQEIAKNKSNCLNLEGEIALIVKELWK
jgi:predicted  nucleic acid-binding Zn-ribbon protein